MKITRYIIGLGLTGILLSIPAFAEPNKIDIDWKSLHLSSRQEKEICNLDMRWQSIRDLIRPVLVRDQECLRLMLFNPDVTDNQVREMQKEIFIKQEQLRYEALENFLAKRRLLSKKQRIMLHNMLH